MKCGSNKFCVGFEPDHKVYCYGNKDGCLWGQNSCNTDQDCKQYSTSSAKYTDGDTPECGKNDLGWRGDACPDPYARGELNYVQTKFNEAKAEYIDLMGKLETSCFSDGKSKDLILNYQVKNGDSDLYDSTSNSNGTVFNNPSYSNGGPGKGYLSLESSQSQYILTQESLNSHLNGTSISVFLWIYPTGDGIVLTELGQSGINQSWHDSQIEIVNEVIKFSVWPYSVVLEHPISLNEWYHVGFVYNQQEAKLTAYVNGVDVASGNMTRAAPNDYSMNLFYAIGATDWTNMGNGGYGNFRFAGMQVYNTALSSSQVQKQYQIPDVTKQCKRADELNTSMQTKLIEMSKLLKTSQQTLPEHQTLLDLAAQLETEKGLLQTVRMENEDLNVLADINHYEWIFWFVFALSIFGLLVYLKNKSHNGDL